MPPSTLRTFPSLMLLAIALLATSAWAQDAAPNEPVPPAGNDAEKQPDSATDTRRERALERLRKLDPERTLDEINPLGELPAIDAAQLARFDELSNTLADESLAGRWPGTPGIEKAAQLIEAEFQALGLEPLFPSTTTSAAGIEVITPLDSFRQRLERGEDVEIVTGTVSIHIDAAREQAIRANGPSLAPTRGASHTVTPISGTGEVTGELVFCGYAVVSGPGGYINFPIDADFTDKIAIVLEGEPMTEDGQSLWAPEGWSFNANLTAKVSAVTRRGASAVLIIRPPSMEAMDPDRKFGQGGRFEGVPVLELAPSFAEALIARADLESHSIADLATLASAAPMVLELSGCTVTVQTDVQRTEKVTHNIGARLPGRGSLRGEYVVVGAHYDHVGLGDVGSESPGTIHPGADDNASGTAALLLAAEQLTRAYERLDPKADARTILFLAFTAEETGLEGSTRYVRRPPLPIADHTLMLNLDMVGRMRDGLLELGGLQSARGLEDMVDPHLADSGLRIRRGSSIGDNRSDHASFDAVRVPNLFFFTGLHDEYHTPADTPDLLNDEGAVRTANLVAAIALEAATMPERLTHLRARRAIGAQTTPRVRVGIVPADHPKGGLSVRQVSDSTSASRAGLEVYDRIIAWNGEPIDVERFGKLLVEQAAGDVVTLTVIRDDEEIEIEMTLSPPG